MDQEWGHHRHLRGLALRYVGRGGRLTEWVTDDLLQDLDPEPARSLIRQLIRLGMLVEVEKRLYPSGLAADEQTPSCFDLVFEGLELADASSSSV